MESIKKSNNPQPKIKNITGDKVCVLLDHKFGSQRCYMPDWSEEPYTVGKLLDGSIAPLRDVMDDATGVIDRQVRDVLAEPQKRRSNMINTKFKYLRSELLLVQKKAH